MSNKIKIEPLLNDTNFLCFVIPNLFSQSECTQLFDLKIQNSFQKAILNYPTYYRNNDRLVIDDEKLSAFLFEKVKPYLPQTIEIKSDVLLENGTWNLLRLNTRLRYCKYNAHQYFNRHLDGVHYVSNSIQSKLTFMIYLNDATEFKGGKTLFYKTKDTKEIWATYIPKKGDLIVFDHNIWHEGEELISGEKFVLRSDILFERNDIVYNRTPFSGHLGYVWKISIFNNIFFLSGGRDKKINVWNKQGDLINSLNGHENSILCIEKINNTTFISGSRDNKIIVWHCSNNGEFRLKATIQIHSALVLSLCKITENIFASSSGDNSIKIVQLDGTVINTFNEHSNWVWQIIKINDSHIISCSEDKSIKIWNLNNSESINTYIETCGITRLAYNNELRKLISGNLNGEITLRDLQNNFSFLNEIKIKAHSGIIRDILIINNSFFASCGEDNKIIIWDINNLSVVSIFEHINFVQSIALTINNKLLSSSYDGTIKEWDISFIFLPK